MDSMALSKQKMFEKQAEILKALAHPLRLAILELLGSGELCACDIANKIGAERTNASKHLAIMVSAGILTSRKEGLKVFYQLRTPCVLDFLSCVNACLREHALENQKILQQLGGQA